VGASELHETVGDVPAYLPTERPLKIFISYRRAEMSGTAWALYLSLKERFGADNVFLDNNNLQGGCNGSTRSSRM
jgi:hypothetical protein